MSDASTQIFRYVIREPPGQVAAGAAPARPDPVAVSHAARAPEPPVRNGKTPAPRGDKTPVPLGAGRRPLPPRRTEHPVSRGDGLLLAAGLLLGIGVGGGIDGSVFDQLLRWQHLLPGYEPQAAVIALKTSSAWDGWVHAITWALMVVGLGLLWRATRRLEAPRRGSTFVGSLLLGWGFYNGVEGAIDHRLLHVYQAHPGALQVLWDSGLLLSSMLLMLIGALCIGLGRR